MRNPSLLVAAAGLAVLVPAAPAAAAAKKTPTLTGTVIAQPGTTHGRATVGVLLGTGSEKLGRIATPLVRASVPLRGGLRAPIGHLEPDQLKLGDRVRFVPASRPTAKGTVRTSRLVVFRRGATPTFRTLTQTRATALSNTATAAQQAAALDSGADTTGTDPALSNVALRQQILGVRGNLNDVILSLRASASGITSALGVIAAGLPADPARRRAVSAKQAPFLKNLTATRDGAGTSADALDQAVAVLDARLDSVGVDSPAPLPVDGVGTVSDALHVALTLLRELPPIPGIPGTPIPQP